MLLKLAKSKASCESTGTIYSQPYDLPQYCIYSSHTPGDRGFGNLAKLSVPCFVGFFEGVGVVGLIMHYI